MTKSASTCRQHNDKKERVTAGMYNLKTLVAHLEASEDYFQGHRGRHDCQCRDPTQETPFSGTGRAAVIELTEDALAQLIAPEA